MEKEVQYTHSNVCLSSIYGLCLLVLDKKYPTILLNSSWGMQKLHKYVEEHEEH